MMKHTTQHTTLHHIHNTAHPHHTHTHTTRTVLALQPTPAGHAQARVRVGAVHAGRAVTTRLRCTDGRCCRAYIHPLHTSIHIRINRHTCVHTATRTRKA